MSGTSLDGVDAALLDTDGECVVEPGPGLTVPYLDIHKEVLRAALAEAPNLRPGVKSPLLRRAERIVDRVHAEAVNTLRRHAGLVPADIAYIGFHGQTVLHRARFSWQIGNGRALARICRIAVIDDFRSADIAAGGQGAPLVPLYHAALVRKNPNLSGPVAVVNIGGVANVTYVDGDTIEAFDTGPGNAPIDDWMHRHTGRAIDDNGTMARSGRVDGEVLQKLLAKPFFDTRPPKSLDRMAFGTEAVEGLGVRDGAATLTAFTAASIARAREHFADMPTTWIVCGGGRHNGALMDALRARVNAPVLAAEDAGWNGDFVEAEAFAYLAARAAKGLPLSLPSTTGVKTPTTGGRLNRKD